MITNKKIKVNLRDACIKYVVVKVLVKIRKEKNDKKDSDI